jgi:hypothetical protein
MLRLLLRFVGYLGLAVGFIAFVVDGARSIANKELAYVSIGSVLDTVLPHAYGGWQEAAKLRLPPALYDPVLVKTLAAPFFVGATVIAVLLLLIGQKPKPKIGYSNRD